MLTRLRKSTSFGGYFDYEKKKRRVEEVNAELEDPNVWSNADRARELGKEKRALDAVVESIDALTNDTSGAAELFELAEMEGDEAT
ncbi:MAG: PCRF domain-containing protein, partial [Casimicrobium sp.]